MFNKVILIGRLGQNAEAKTAQNNREYVVLSIATQESWRNDKGDYETRTEWHRVYAWQGLSKFARTLQKGQLVTLEGTLRYREVDFFFNYKGMSEIYSTGMKRAAALLAAALLLAAGSARAGDVQVTVRGVRAARGRGVVLTGGGGGWGVCPQQANSDLNASARSFCPQMLWQEREYQAAMWLSSMHTTKTASTLHRIISQARIRGRIQEGAYAGRTFLSSRILLGNAER